MGILIKTRSQLLRESLDRLRSSNLLTNLAPGRAAYILSQIHADHLGELYDALEANFSQAFVSSAEGPFLDLIAELFGIFRLPQQAALALADERNVRFFVQTGTLASKIATKVIPVGTTLTTASGTPTYQVLEEARFNDVATEVYVSVVSEGVGPDQNVGTAELSEHSLGVADVLVTNEAALNTAADVETDEQLRARLADASLTRATGNMASIREAVNVIPGVSEVRLQPYRNGPGTVQATVIPVSTTIAPSLLPMVENSVEQVRGAGTIIDHRGPRFADVEITLLLRFREDTPEGLKPELRQQAAQALLDYIGSIRLGGTFFVQEMTQRVLSVSEQILEYQTQCFAFRGRPQVRRNFQTDPDELLRPDPSLEQPIRVL